MAKRKPAVGLFCRCGCGEKVTPGRRYRPGHDARFHGRIKKIKDGRLKLSELPGLGVRKYAMAEYRREARK